MVSNKYFVNQALICLLNVRTILPYGQFGVNPAWTRDCLAGCGWLEICVRVCGNFILKFVKGADGGGVDIEFPVRKETARKSRVMIGAWGKLFARFNLLLLCFSSHSLYPTGQFSGGPFIIQGRLCPVSRLPSRSPVRVCCTARGIDVLGLGAAGASGKQWSVAGFMHPIRLGWHTDRNLRPQ